MYPNWFEITAIENFKNNLLPFADRKNLNFLQIGAYTGDASKWLLENVLTHESSRLTDVDTWLGSDEDVHNKMDWSDVERVYDEKIEQYKDKITKVKSDSLTFLRNEHPFTYDFIYIDGDHTALGVFSDAVGSFPLLKSYGVLAFDDYTWQSGKSPEHEPRKGIHQFLKLAEGSYNLITNNSQIWIQCLDRTEI